MAVRPQSSWSRLGKVEKVLALVTIAGVLGLLGDYLLVEPLAERQISHYEVRQGVLELHGEPRADSGCPTRLYPGAEFVLTSRRHGDRWVFARVTGCGGWTTTDAIERQAARMGSGTTSDDSR